MNSTNSPPPHLGRVDKPFRATDAAHTVVKAAELVGWEINNAEQFLRKVQHVEYGLSSEIEFATLLRWLGWCSFVHRLSEDVLEDPIRSQLIVPDLCAVFSVDDRRCSALIEVKTSESMVLKFKKSYLAQLQAYAELMHQPLLIAWRPRSIGFWMLFDPKIAQPIDDESVAVDFGAAIKNDLMSVLAGDYYIVPKKGAGLRFEYERIGEKQPTADGYQAVFRVSNAYLHDAAGKQADDVPDTIVWTILSALEDCQEVREDGFGQAFVASGGMTRAQLVLRTAIGFSLKGDERIHWKAVGKNLDAVLNCETLLSDLQKRFETFVSYVFHLLPEQIPPFLPPTWLGRQPGRHGATESEIHNDREA